MSTRTLLTAEDFATTGSETDGFELVRGELSPMPPPAEEHGIVAANVVFLLKAFTKARGNGVVLCNDSGLLTEKDPDTVRGVDVMLFMTGRKPAKDSRSPYSSLPPDLAVEIRSPSQSWKSMMEKVLEYLNMGVRLVWVIDPRVRRVTVFTPEEEPRTLAGEDDLDGGETLPGFHCRVDEVFEGI